MMHRARIGKAGQRTVLALFLLAGLALCAAAALLFDTGADEGSVGKSEFVVLPTGTGRDHAAMLSASPTSIYAGDMPAGIHAENSRRFADDLVLVPRNPGIASSGFIISGQSDQEALAEHRLRVGDVLLTMDGQPLDPDRIANLAKELAAFDTVEVSYERAGQLRRRLLTFN